MKSSATKSYTFYLGHSMYTPSNIRLRPDEISSGDRPYAAWAYVAFTRAVCERRRYCAMAWIWAASALRARRTAADFYSPQHHQLAHTAGLERADPQRARGGFRYEYFPAHGSRCVSSM